MVVIEMNDGGIMKLELDEVNAPITVANFLKLVNEHFYDGLIFHRVIKNFMIQGGDPTGTGMGGSKENIKGEFTSNGVNNQLKHTRGTISMARAMHPDSASSQFFICHVDTPHLDGSYAAFGRVLEGNEHAARIQNVRRNHQDRPLVDQVIASIHVETAGHEYPFDRL